jgi:Arc/MetJ-type ribon-helix-helix transcriptional regulator
MEKLSILFSAPQLARLRQMAKRSHRSVSDLVRTAVDAWLATQPPRPALVREAPPVFGLGDLRTEPSALRDTAWHNRLQG